MKPNLLILILLAVSALAISARADGPDILEVFIGGGAGGFAALGQAIHATPSLMPGAPATLGELAAAGIAVTCSAVSGFLVGDGLASLAFGDRVIAADEKAGVVLLERGLDSS